MEIINNTPEHQENSTANTMDIASITSNEQLTTICEDIENPESVTKNIGRFIDNTRKDYDNYA